MINKSYLNVRSFDKDSQKSKNIQLESKDLGESTSHPQLYQSIIFSLSQEKQKWHPLAQLVLSKSQNLPHFNPNHSAVNFRNSRRIRIKNRQASTSKSLYRNSSLLVIDAKDQQIHNQITQTNQTQRFNRRSCEGQIFGANSRKIKEIYQLYNLPLIPQQFFQVRKQVLKKQVTVPIDVRRVILQKRLKTHGILKRQSQRRTKTMKPPIIANLRIMRSQSAGVIHVPAYLEPLPQDLVKKINSTVSNSASSQRRPSQPLVIHRQPRTFKETRSIIMYLQMFAQEEHIDLISDGIVSECSESINRSLVTSQEGRKALPSRRVIKTLLKPRENTVTRFVDTYNHPQPGIFRQQECKPSLTSSKFNYRSKRQREDQSLQNRTVLMKSQSLSKTPKTPSQPSSPYMGPKNFYSSQRSIPCIKRLLMQVLHQDISQSSFATQSRSKNQPKI